MININRLQRTVRGRSPPLNRSVMVPKRLR